MQDPQTPDEQAAVAQAANDAAVWAKLEEERKARLAARAEQQPIVIETDDVDADEESIIEPRIPMNRAERRQQVRMYAALLAASEKQTPVVNPTIIPKSKRRRRAGQKGRLQHA